MNLADVISAITSAATSILPSGTMGVLITAGAVIGAAVVLIRRVVRAGR